MLEKRLVTDRGLKEITRLAMGAIISFDNRFGHMITRIAASEKNNGTSETEITAFSQDVPYFHALVRDLDLANPKSHLYLLRLGIVPENQGRPYPIRINGDTYYLTLSQLNPINDQFWDEYLGQFMKAPKFF